MNKRLSNKVNSFRATEEVMNSNQTIWSKSVKAVALFALIVAKLKLLVGYDKQKNKKQPSSVLKKDQKTKIIELAVKISKSAIDYAVGINDLELEFKVKVNKSDLERLKENSLLTTLTNLYELVLPFADKLIHLAATDITDFKAQIDAFAAKMPKPQAEMDHSKTATSTLDSIVWEINSMFTTLDKHIDPFEYTNPDFYHDYKNSRVNKDLKKKSKKKTAQKVNKTGEK